MEAYIVFGADRAAGAIGILERFVIRVEAADAKAAEEAARAQRYSAGREHVHIAGARHVTALPVWFEGRQV